MKYTVYSLVSSHMNSKSYMVPITVFYCWACGKLCNFPRNPKETQNPITQKANISALSNKRREVNLRFLE